MASCAFTFGSPSPSGLMKTPLPVRSETVRRVSSVRVSCAASVSRRKGPSPVAVKIFSSLAAAQLLLPIVGTSDIVSHVTKTYVGEPLIVQRTLTQVMHEAWQPRAAMACPALRQ